MSFSRTLLIYIRPLAVILLPVALLYVLIIFGSTSLHAQEEISFQAREKAQDSQEVIPIDTLTERIMFYNVENAFWPLDDPEREDDEFTPGGGRHWSFNRLRTKLNHLTRVILAAGGGRVPMLVGLAEVEGDSVMNYWLHRTPLYRTGYRYLVTIGPDVRGIQIGLLYHPSSFRLLHHESYEVQMPEGERPTRPLLHAAGRIITGDTIDVIVVHQPSRLGGVLQTQAKRDAARTTLFHVADSISAVRLHPYIIMMGDMNENPRSYVMQENQVPFVNLMHPIYQHMQHTPSAVGTHKYQGEWSLIDHFIVHPDLLKEDSPLRLKDPRIVCLPFMMTEDATHQGDRPYRSYYGYRYEGGYSDHLPIIVDLKFAF